MIANISGQFLYSCIKAVSATDTTNSPTETPATVASPATGAGPEPVPFDATPPVPTGATPAVVPVPVSEVIDDISEPMPAPAMLLAMLLAMDDSVQVDVTTVADWLDDSDEVVDTDTEVVTLVSVTVVIAMEEPDMSVGESVESEVALASLGEMSVKLVAVSSELDVCAMALPNKANSARCLMPIFNAYFNNADQCRYRARRSINQDDLGVCPKHLMKGGGPARKT